MINLRTAHLPYEENYDQHNEPLPSWPVDPTLPREERQRNAYDNAIGCTDDVLAEVIARFDQLQGERYLLITGDHGQLLGEGGRWGHNDLLPQVAEVPVMVLAREAPEAAPSRCAVNSGSATTRPGYGWPSASASGWRIPTGSPASTSCRASSCSATT